MSKSAAILFVHNEVDTIGWWLAHHATIGFSTLIVCDDHSTDGTRAALSNAATLYDIRVQSADTTLPTRLERQTRFHKNALAQGRDEFDWMMILAADEYLHFETARSVAEFTAGATEATMAINWCLFGSSGRMTPSAFSPVETFTRHGLLSLPDHRVVRHLVQPRHLDNSLPDPFSALDRNAVWDEARILHFAASDRESFFKRDSSATPEQAWQNFDRNDAEYGGASRWLPESRRIASFMTQASLTDLYWRLKAVMTHADKPILQKLGLTPAQLSVSLSSRLQPQFRFCTLGESQRLMLDMQSGSLVPIGTTDTNFGRYNPLVMALEVSDTDIWNACLFVENPLPGRYLPLAGSPTLLPMVPLRIRIAENTVLSPVSGDEIHIAIPDHALTEIDSTVSLYSRMTPFMVLTAEGHNLAGLLRGIDRLPAPDASALGCAIAMLPFEEAERLSDAFPGVVPRNVRPARPSQS
ncbi:glycosyltransferase family 2 protein [Gluconobacter cerevisiae]|uniref:Glycosyltransferase family 2 protein n=1 Tax=Gluconobacter cerevisiae TaxID=1379734 RepID=A0ABR9YCW1_9PROT|nr:glycosyltransferase family 2 protein [Gluconobacter cerevisiae]MBF0876490.1 glycosyltransferase family 2 protein [Gluconobacter cerevisiae]